VQRRYSLSLSLSHSHTHTHCAEEILKEEELEVQRREEEQLELQRVQRVLEVIP
jgi:hypothetical protein